jgi:hypothetical protein
MKCVYPLLPNQFQTMTRRDNHDLWGIILGVALALLAIALN